MVITQVLLARDLCRGAYQVFAPSVVNKALCLFVGGQGPAAHKGGGEVRGRNPGAPYTPFRSGSRKVDGRLTEKGDSNFNDARPVHLIKWIRASELSIKKFLSLQRNATELSV